MLRKPSSVNAFSLPFSAILSPPLAGIVKLMAVHTDVFGVMPGSVLCRFTFLKTFRGNGLNNYFLKENSSEKIILDVTSYLKEKFDVLPLEDVLPICRK